MHRNLKNNLVLTHAISYILDRYDIINEIGKRKKKKRNGDKVNQKKKERRKKETRKQGEKK